jgi:lipopolysaccharide export system protein LptA
MRSVHQRLRVYAVIAAGAVAAAGGGVAFAQPKRQAQPPQQEQPQQPGGPPNALQGFSQNRNEPVKINAASLDVRDRSKVATFSGNVQLVQGDTKLRCQTLVVYYDGDNANGPAVKSATPGPAGNSQIRRMEAKGGVLVTQKDQTATGDSAVYDLKDNTVRLFPSAGGTVAVTQGPNVVRGPRLVVHLDTGVSHFEGGVESLIIPSSTKGERSDAKGGPAENRAAPKAPGANPKGLY